MEAEEQNQYNAVGSRKLSAVGENKIKSSGNHYLIFNNAFDVFKIVTFMDI
jgi:hypothetical protein